MPAAQHLSGQWGGTKPEDVLFSVDKPNTAFLVTSAAHGQFAGNELSFVHGTITASRSTAPVVLSLDGLPKV